MAGVIRLADEDNVAVAARGLERGAVVEVDGAEVVVREAVPFAHKVAIRPIAQGAKVLKYGVPIGRAKAAIAPGEHVHVHNVESDYVNNQVDFFEAADAGEGTAP